MADLSQNIEDAWNELLNQAAQQLVDFYKFRADVFKGTGALKNSIQAQVVGDQIDVAYLRYGVYQDFGVQGWGTGKNYAPNSPFQYKDRPDTGYNNMRIYGIPPKYWASNPDGTPRVPESVVEIIENGLARAIEDTLTISID